MRVMQTDDDDEINNGACAVKKETTESYPYSVRQEDLKIGDWLVVTFNYSNAKTSTSKQSSKNFIGQLVNLADDETFEAKFVRPYTSNEFRGFIFKYPAVEDISPFTHNQIIGKIRDPEPYKRGLLKFDVNIM